ncbi:hypothetical protein [Brevibacillus dissolubilis]|uniref:hypothetical protein n=1 Tax=Brevibacillus dissolubilis TaxID=1844116 RepID=UPI00111723D9|nr:hypothetical protein [Brevibacillus dissolubilis]
MVTFELADLEKIHLALDMAQRFTRGEKYHGDKPQLLIQQFDQLMEKVRDARHVETYQMENDHMPDAKSVQDANTGNQNPSI